MPRRNNRKVKPSVHEPSRFDAGFNPKCCGCAFAGAEFKCMSSDGKCLKTSHDAKEADNAGSQR